MRYLATLILLCSCCALQAQGKWGIRVNQNTDFFSVTYRETNTTTHTTRTYEEPEVRMSRISAAILHVNRGYAQELELFVPQVNGSQAVFPWPHDVRTYPPNSENKYSSYAMRYGVSKNVYSVTRSFALSLGGGLNTYFLKVENAPHFESSFPVLDYVAGLSLNAIPGVNLQASKQLSFVLDCPLKIFDFYYRTVNIKNPAIPLRQQRTNSFETDFFTNAFTVRLGAAYTFGG